MKKDIRVLDVTLRDGGCVIDFDFGLPYMQKIVRALEASGVDVIELGYIDSEKGSEEGRTKFSNERVIYTHFLKTKKPGVTYVAMIDRGRFDPELLETKNERSIDGIRYCFHKKDFKSIASACQTIHDKGYRVFVQPMITMRYSEEELSQLIDIVNNEIPFVSGFYIVDSFGEMRADDLRRIASFVDGRLNPIIPLGFHSHNNMQLSYSNAMEFISLPMKRPIMVDSSIMGMGKGAGNLNTELLLEHLNAFNGGNYEIEGLLRAIDEAIEPIHSEHYWGYSVEYFLSSKYHCSPSYASYFYNKHMLPIDGVARLLSLVKEEKRISFDKEYAEMLYQRFRVPSGIDDSRLIDELRLATKGKDALLIAPGKSILGNETKISTLSCKESIISFALNMPDFIDTDYQFITRSNLKTLSPKRAKRIYSSAILANAGENDYVLDSKKYVLLEEKEMHDSSSVLCINLLLSLGVKRFFLAGFDGFNSAGSQNYYSYEYRNSLDYEQAQSRNDFYSLFFRQLKKKVEVVFVTPSIYED